MIWFNLHAYTLWHWWHHRSPIHTIEVQECKIILLSHVISIKNKTKQGKNLIDKHKNANTKEIIVWNDMHYIHFLLCFNCCVIMCNYLHFIDINKRRPQILCVPPSILLQSNLLLSIIFIAAHVWKTFIDRLTTKYLWRFGLFCEYKEKKNEISQFLKWASNESMTA